jgi:hypothetical protein
LRHLRGFLGQFHGFVIFTRHLLLQ